MDEERYLDLALRAQLGELDAEERAQFETERAARGAAGEAALDDLRETLGALALAAAPVAPRPGLRVRVLEAASAERAAVTPIRPSRAWPFATAAAALLAGMIGLWALDLREDRQRLSAELGFARDRLAAADSASAALASARSDLELLASPVARVVALAGAGPSPGASARVFVDPATGRAILFARDLPILPAESLYELWAIRGETPRPAGVFRPGPDGRARLEIADAALLDGVDALAVTIEPAPGTQSPTGAMVLVPVGT